MTKDDIASMAREAGAEIDRELWIFFEHECLHFAALVAAHEREACASLVEDHAMQYAHPAWAVELINDIRARGKS